jgi:hypothetical protein
VKAKDCCTFGGAGSGNDIRIGVQCATQFGPIELRKLSSKRHVSTASGILVDEVGRVRSWFVIIPNRQANPKCESCVHHVLQFAWYLL